VDNNLVNRAITLFWIIFRLNLLLIVSNVAAIVVVLFVIFHWFTLPLYLFGVFLLIVSLQGLLLTLRRLDRLEKMSLTKLYVLCYREELKGTAVFALCYVLAIAVLLGAFSGLRYVQNPGLIFPFYYLLAAVLYVHLIFSMLVRANFFINIVGAWRLGLYLISKHYFYAMLIFVCTVILGVLANNFPALIILGILPMAGYLLTAYTKKIIRRLTVDLKVSESENITQKEIGDASENDSK